MAIVVFFAVGAGGPTALEPHNTEECKQTVADLAKYVRKVHNAAAILYARDGDDHTPAAERELAQNIALGINTTRYINKVTQATFQQVASLPTIVSFLKRHRGLPEWTLPSGYRSQSAGPLSARMFPAALVKQVEHAMATVAADDAVVVMDKTRKRIDENKLLVSQMGGRFNSTSKTPIADLNAKSLIANLDSDEEKYKAAKTSELMAVLNANDLVMHLGAVENNRTVKKEGSPTSAPMKRVGMFLRMTTWAAKHEAGPIKQKLALQKRKREQKLEAGHKLEAERRRKQDRLTQQKEIAEQKAAKHAKMGELSRDQGVDDDYHVR